MSIQTKIEKAGIKARRKLWDHKLKLVGKSTKVLRIKVLENKYGDEEQEIISNNLIDVTIDYPLNQIPLNRFRKTNNTGNNEDISDAGIFLFDVIPIDFYTKFEDNVEKGDLIIDTIKDEKGIIVPILLRTSETIGSFFSELLWKKMLISPYNGEISNEIQKLIDEFILSLNEQIILTADKK